MLLSFSFTATTGVNVDLVDDDPLAVVRYWELVSSADVINQIVTDFIIL